MENPGRSEVIRLLELNIHSKLQKLDRNATVLSAPTELEEVALVLHHVRFCRSEL
jgi:hypothetical protein